MAGWHLAAFYSVVILLAEIHPVYSLLFHISLVLNEKKKKLKGN